MLEIELGDFPSLEDRFTRILAELKGPDPLTPVAVIAPSSRILDRLKELACQRVCPELINTYFFTFYSLTHQIIKERHTFPEGMRLIEDPIFFEHLVSKLINDHFPESLYLGRGLKAPGFACALYQTLRDLRDARVDPNLALEAWREGFLHPDSQGIPSPVMEKVREILGLYYLFEQALDVYKVLDPCTLTGKAIELAPNSPILARMKKVIYYGFYELTQLQLDMFRTIAEHYPTTLLFPYLEGSKEYAFAKEFFQTYILGLGHKITHLPQKAPKPQPKLISTTSTYDEVWYVAKEILHLVEQGYEFSEIGVVARDLGKYHSWVQEIFNASRIPYVTSATMPLARLPQVKLCYQLLNLARYDFARDKVLEVISSPCFKLKDREDPHLWDIKTRELGISRGIEKWAEQLDTTQTPAQIVQSIAGDLRFLSKSSSWGWFCEGTWTLWNKYLELSPDISSQLSQILSQIKALDILGEEVFGARFLEHLTHRLMRATLPQDTQIRGVKVLDAMSARALPFRVLFLMGLNEKVFPRFILEDPFLRDSFRSRLSFTLGCKLPQKLKGYDEEKLLFELLTHSAEKIYYLYQRADEEARIQIPSPYIQDYLKEVLHLPRRFSDKIELYRTPLLTPQELGVKIGLGQGQLQRLFAALDKNTQSINRSLRHIQIIEGMGGLTPADGHIGPSGELWQRLLNEGISPTSLQHLATCPFKFMAERLLGLKSLPEPETRDELERLDIGTICHQALALYYEGQDNIPELKELVDQVIESHLKTNPIRYPFIAGLRKQEILELLSDFVKQTHQELKESGWQPRFIESPKDKTPFKLPLVEIPIHGYIDRIDTKYEGNTLKFRVIDYKTGKKPEGGLLGSILKGEEFQAPIYIFLAEAFLRQNLGLKPLPAGVWFVYLVHKVVETLSYERLYQNKRTLKRYLAFLQGLIRGGTFYIQRHHQSCSRCEYSMICRRNHLPSWRRATRSKEARAWQRLKTGS